MAKNILLTGHPQVGKTTLIRKLVEDLQDFRLAGFFTIEVLKSGKRQGFRLVMLDGASEIFAHRDFDAPDRHRIGAYGVRPRVLEDLILPRLSNLDEVDLVVIDEIAKMELLSRRFRTRVEELLDSPKPILATIALRGTGILRRLKGHQDARLFRLTPKNRDALRGEVLRELRKTLAKRG